MKKIRLLKQIASLRTDLGITITSNNKNPIIDKYMNGDFNSLDADKFREMIKNVYSEGLDISNISTGVVNWFSFDTDRFAA